MRSAWRTGDAIAASCFGSLRSAWRQQVPRRVPGNNVRRLWLVLSKPSVRIPLTRYDGSCWEWWCVETPIGLGQGRGTGLRRIAQVPDHAAVDNGGRYTFSVRQ